MSVRGVMTQRLHVKYNGEFLADIIMRMNALRQWDHQLRETKNYKETLDEGCFEGSQNPLDVHNAVRTRAYFASVDQGGNLSAILVVFCDDCRRTGWLNWINNVKVSISGQVKIIENSPRMDLYRVNKQKHSHYFNSRS